MSGSSSQKPVRVRVERGIYRRTTRDGRTRYEIAFLDRSGRQRWETVAKLSDARRRRAELIAKPQEERQPSSRQTFGDLAEQWWDMKKRKLREGTAAGYRAGLDLVALPAFGTWRVALIDPDSIASLIRSLEDDGLHALHPDRPKRPLSHSTIVNHLKPLQQVLDLAVRRRIIPANPFKLLTADERPARDDETRKPHEWETAEVSRLIAASRELAAERSAPEVRRTDYSVALLTVATLGLRRGEVCGLQWRDFDEGEDAHSATLTVERQWLGPTRIGDVRVPARFGPPKTEAGTRVLAVPADLRRELLALKLRSPFSQPGDPIFASMSGTPLTNLGRRGFDAARDRAGLPSYLTLHDLRDVAPSRLIAAGVDDSTIADQIGHGDSSITRKLYAHIFDRREKMQAVRAALAGVGAAQTDA
jgi:integrase